MVYGRVSADTKTCGSPRNPSPAGVPSKAGSATSSLPSGKQTDILTQLQTKVKKKMTPKTLFFGHPPSSFLPLRKPARRMLLSGELFTSFQSGIERSWYFASKSRFLQFFKNFCHHFCSAFSLLLRL